MEEEKRAEATMTDNRHRVATLRRRKKISENTYEFQFHVEQPFSFEAGQYVWVVVPNLIHSDTRGERRPMSIASAPNANGDIRIFMRRGESGFKKTLMEMRVGAKLTVIGPFGFSFCFPEDPNIPVVLIAGGVGIAPFCSLIQSMKENIERKVPIRLLYADRSEARAPYLEDLRAWAKGDKRLEYSFISGEISPNDFKPFLKDKAALYFVSGSQNFVDVAHASLLEHGIADNQMRFENFHPTMSFTKFIHEAFLGNSSKISPVDVNHDTESRLNILFSAIESTSHHIVITDVQGNVIYANAAAQRMTGFTFDEMLGNTPRLWGGLMPRSFYRDFWKTIGSGNRVDTELINRRKDGTLYSVLAHISPIKDLNGEVVAYIGTEEDVSYIRSAEREEKEARMEAERQYVVLERMNRLMVGRELRMREMKQTIKKLKEGSSHHDGV
ncbi:hypothetical protein A2348_03940 [Candidatus Uhrbacteria bacterium RIFOXYB12_FULL_58_10]|nr:MAG: hypothetical protein A2348_03940 [Candidatus Uhrbacteria bacterium RIFOXYB12_FULL_58_10]